MGQIPEVEFSQIHPVNQFHEFDLEVDEGRLFVQCIQRVETIPSSGKLACTMIAPLRSLQNTALPGAVKLTPAWAKKAINAA